jgi:outer membrane receptor protein involved in Fe transport
LKLGYQYAGFGKIRIDYSYLKIQNPDDPDFYFILIPEHNLGILNEFSFAKRFTLLASYRYISERNSYTDGSYPVKEYGLVNADLTLKLAKYLDFRASVHNLFDVNYFYSEGYPARGRNFSFGLTVDL